MKKKIADYLFSILRTLGRGRSWCNAYKWIVQHNWVNAYQIWNTLDHFKDLWII